MKHCPGAERSDQHTVLSKAGKSTDVDKATQDSSPLHQMPNTPGAEGCDQHTVLFKAWKSPNLDQHTVLFKAGKSPNLDQTTQGTSSLHWMPNTSLAFASGVLKVTFFPFFPFFPI